MSENLKLWNAVEKTNPAHTKNVTFGRSITAIDPYRQIQAATNQFGPAGTGWGWDVKQVEHLPTNEVCILISLWHGEGSGRVEQWGQASLYIDKAEKKKDTDCMKKATTDGVTKCLSILGFNADIFLGKYEDNKYVQQVTQEFNKPVRTVLDAYNYNLPCINGMREAFDKQDYTYFIQCWDEITGDSEADVNTGKNDKTLLWVAPTKYKEHGLPEPVFTTEQRAFLKENAAKYRESK